MAFLNTGFTLASLPYWVALKTAEAEPAVRFAMAIEEQQPARGSGAMKALMPLGAVLALPGWR